MTPSVIQNFYILEILIKIQDILTPIENNIKEFFCRSQSQKAKSARRAKFRTNSENLTTDYGNKLFCKNFIQDFW